jgi:hypothetical protein
MAERILDLVQRHDFVSFAELTRKIAGFSGDREMVLRNNLVLWSGLSKSAERSLSRLWRSGRIAFEPANPLVYLVDGQALEYPLARSPFPYAEPHWLPVVLRPAESAPEWTYVPGGRA